MDTQIKGGNPFTSRFVPVTSQAFTTTPGDTVIEHYLQWESASASFQGAAYNGARLLGGADDFLIVEVLDGCMIGLMGAHGQDLGWPHESRVRYADSLGLRYELKDAEQ